MPSSRSILLGAVGVLASAALAACGGGDNAADPTSAPDQVTSGAPNAAKDPATWPFTGLPVKKGDAAMGHPTLVLKLDNTSSSAPQVGLGSADMVVEELVEGGITRLAAFYYSELPDDVGPVRSVRASDIGIVSPVNGRLVTSGGAFVTLNRLAEADVPISSDGSAGFYRNSSRYSPYNLFTDMTAVAKAAALKKDARPDDYLPFTSDQQVSGPKATDIAVTFSPSHTTTWAYGANGYENTDSHAGEGDHFPTDTVLVLRVDVGDAGYLDPAGSPVPETIFRGDGEAMMFHGGKVVKGTWSKKQLDSALQLRTANGEDLQVPAGHVWIELVPKSGGNVTY